MWRILLAQLQRSDEAQEHQNNIHTEANFVPVCAVPLLCITLNVQHSYSAYSAVSASVRPKPRTESQVGSTRWKPTEDQSQVIAVTSPAKCSLVPHSHERWDFCATCSGYVIFIFVFK